MASAASSAHGGTAPGRSVGMGSRACRGVPATTIRRVITGSGAGRGAVVATKTVDVASAPASAVFHSASRTPGERTTSEASHAAPRSAVPWTR
jgi:hypothetical protein